MLPLTIQLSGTSLLTTLPDPTNTLLPMVIFTKIITPEPSVTLSIIVGLSEYSPLLPFVVRCIHEKFCQIDSAFIIVQ